MATYTEPLHLDLTAPVRSGGAEAASASSSRESPLILGVLGHRDIDSNRVPRLREALAALLAEIKQHLPDTELRVIVGVTRGGDLAFAAGRSARASDCFRP